MSELEFIELIKDKRYKKKMSQKELSKLTSIPTSKLCKIENGNQKLNFNDIRILSIILEIDLNQIKHDYCQKNAIYYD